MRKRLPAAMAALCALWLTACNLSSGNEERDIAASPTPAGTWISLMAPAAGAQVTLGAHLEIKARVENASDEIERIEIQIDGQIIQRYLLPNRDGAGSVPILENWLADGPGERELRIYVCFADGRCIESAPLTFAVVAPTSEAAQDERAGSLETAADEGQPAAGQPTAALATATAPVTPTTAIIMARVIVEVMNVRAGPSTRFAVVSTLQHGEEVRVFARTEDDWYKFFVRQEARWIYRGDTLPLLELDGPAESLPIDRGPDLPTAPPATATPLPPQYPNLVIEQAELVGGHLVCGVAGQLRFRIVNAGVAPTNWGGSVTVVDRHVASGETRNFPVEVFGVLAAGDSTPLYKVSLLVDTHYDEEHRLEIAIDAQNQIQEANEADNHWHFSYQLARGECPQ